MAPTHDPLSVLPQWLIDRLLAGRFATMRPTSYAPVLTRLQRGLPAMGGDRRRRPRILSGEAWRGRVLDLEG
ncbi:hypothetical protein [Benzoatithermus flavus]|uniref:Uncharacterized protein n=1 Tax=Benzoatithermus flavus TaxID=3108223 RepID=A0ABU8XTP3_9PROT